MNTDFLNAKILSHRSNLQRYATLLSTQLTERERKYLHKRIEEERAEVASLELERAAKKSRYRPQSSSASRFTAGASGFLNLSQSGDVPNDSANRGA